jgi:type I restriction enzyme S subunit
MNKFQSYQETNFEWIGNIPKEWKLSRIGKFFNQRLEKVDDITYPPLSVTMSGIVDQLSNVAKTDDGSNRKLVKKNDFVINSRSDRKGSSGISPRDGSVSLINIVLEPKEIHPDFIEHLFKSYNFKEEYYRNGKGIHADLWTTKWDQLKNIYIPVPSLNEQKLISKYLEKKKNLINSLIEKTKKKILILKEKKNSLINQITTKGLDMNVSLKDSGVEWIGKIPEHWKKKALKYEFYMKGRIGWKGLKQDEFLDKGDYLLITGHDIHNDKINWKKCYHISEKRFLESPEISLKIEDLLFTKDGTIGKTLFIDYLPKPSSLNSHLLLIRSISGEYSTKFLQYVFKSNQFLVYVEEKKTGTTFYGVSQNTMENFKCYFPPKKEQELIGEYLDKKCNKINKLIDLENKKLIKLNHLLNTLVHSAVTGKVKITEKMV